MGSTTGPSFVGRGLRFGMFTGCGCAGDGFGSRLWPSVIVLEVVENL